MDTVDTIKKLSQELIVKPAREFDIQEFKASALLYVDIVETLLSNLTVDKINHEHDNKKENDIVRPSNDILATKKK